MFKKFGIGMLAIVLAVSFSAFTAAPKSSPAKSFDPPTLFWYQVDPVTQEILQNEPVYQEATEMAVESPCPEVNEIDCIRGFETALDLSSGPNSDETPYKKRTSDPTR